MSTAMFTETLRFIIYRTIVSSPKQDSFEKSTASVFHSSSLTDGSRLFFWWLFGRSFTGTWIFGSYRTRVLNIFRLRKKAISLLRSITESRCKTTVTPPNVHSHVHPDAKVHYLSNDSFKSQTRFLRKEYRFGVSFIKLDRWKQTVFLVVVRKKFHRDMNFW